MVQFKTEDEWFEGYVAPTMENIKRGLNDDGNNLPQTLRIISHTIEKNPTKSQTDGYKPQRRSVSNIQE